MESIKANDIIVFQYLLATAKKLVKKKSDLLLYDNNNTCLYKGKKLIYCRHNKIYIRFNEYLLCDHQSVILALSSRIKEIDDAETSNRYK